MKPELRREMGKVARVLSATTGTARLDRADVEAAWFFLVSVHFEYGLAT
jgi:hypothetical protein